MRRTLFWHVSALLFLAYSLAQDKPPDIEKYLARVEAGGAELVRAEIPSLLSKYPNDPGILYLQGVLTTDGTEAVRVYQSIVDNFPQSEWADDALYKVYQFYYAIGLYRTAEIKLNQLKTDFPQSRYISVGAQADVKSLPEEKGNPQSAQPTQGNVVQGSPTQPQADKPTLPEGDLSQSAGEEKGQYTLQVGAFSQQVNAEKQKLFFEDLGYSVELVNKVRDSRSLFVVLVGDYESPDQARLKSEEIKTKYNISSMVVTR